MLLIILDWFTYVKWIARGLVACVVLGLVYFLYEWLLLSLF